MPIVLIETNVPEANIPSTFVNDVSAGVAASLGKSQDVSRLITTNLHAPCIVLSIDFMVVGRYIQNMS